MDLFTRGYELITGITNIFIFALSLYYFVKLKNNKKSEITKDKMNNLWVPFFALMSIAGGMGAIIHGIDFTQSTVDFLWIILSFIFSIIINTLLVIFLDIKNKKIQKIAALTGMIYFVIALETIFKIDFLLTFTLYACVCLILCTVICIKKREKYNKFILYGLLSQFAGGIFLIVQKIRIPWLYLDKNGIYHIFALLTLFLFYKGICDENK